MTGRKVIPFPSSSTCRASVDVHHISELAAEAERLLATPSQNLDLRGLLNLLERANRTLAELGTILLSDGELSRMDRVLRSLDELIERTREHVAQLEQVAKRTD